MHARGDLADAASLFEESLELFRALGDKAGVAMALSNLGVVAEGEGEYAKAAAFYTESLDLYREVGEKRGIALLACRLGGISRMRGDHGRAAALYDESLLLHRELGERLGISQDFEGIAAMHAAGGQPETAVRLWAAAEALRERIGVPPRGAMHEGYEPLLASVRETLGEEAFASVWAEGRGLTPEQALDGWRAPGDPPRDSREDPWQKR